MRFKLIFIVFTLLFTMIPLTGCAGVGETIEQTAAWRDKAIETKSDSQAALDELLADRQSFPDGSQQAALINAAIARTHAKIAALNAAIVNADLVIEEATNPTDGITQITQQLLPFIPAPAQAPVLLGAALLATLARSKQLKNGADSIIKSIQHTISRDESFKAAFISNADTIRTIQTPLARKMVDRIQRVG